MATRSECQGRSAAHGIKHIDSGGGKGSRLTDANQIRFAAPVQEKLLEGIAGFALRVQTAEFALELRIAQDVDRQVHGPARKVVDERADGGSHPHDGAHAAGNFFDVHTRKSRSHWHGSALLLVTDDRQAAWRPTRISRFASWPRVLMKMSLSTCAPSSATLPAPTSTKVSFSACSGFAVAWTLYFRLSP